MGFRACQVSPTSEKSTFDHLSYYGPDLAFFIFIFIFFQFIVFWGRALCNKACTFILRPFLSLLTCSDLCINPDLAFSVFLPPLLVKSTLDSKEQRV